MKKNLDYEAVCLKTSLTKILRVMKFTLLLILFTTVQLFATVYSQTTRLSINMKNATLADIFEEIEEKSEFRFLYNNEMIKKENLPYVSCNGKTINEILDQVLEGTGNSYSILENNLIVITPTGVQQRSDVKGKVTNTSGESVPGATVLIKGTTNGTITDVDGNYSLSNVPSDATLVFSFVGMQAQEVPVAGKTVVNVVLSEEVINIDEVVAIGYGTQSRAMITTSVSKMDKQVLENVPYANAASALQGTLSGVRVQSTSGQPGDAPRIIVRGGTSIDNPNGAAPLYVIDGVVRTDMNGIASEDIESIQVLKDAASTAIYGARASNGIVLIETKTGKSGKVTVSYNYDLTVSEVGAKYDVLNAHDYIYYQRLGILETAKIIPSAMNALNTSSGYGTGNDLTANTAYTTMYLTPENEYKLSEGWESMPDPADPSKTIIYKGTDWQDVMFRTGVSHNHYVSATGGNAKTRFNMGVGYRTDDGIALATGYKRLSLNMGGEIQVAKDINVFGRIGYASTSSKVAYSIVNLFFRSAAMVPTLKYTFEDGSLAPGMAYNTGNPKYFLGRDKSESNSENLTLIIGGHWKNILPGLSFDPQLSLFRRDGDSYTFMPSYLDGINKPVTTRTASSSYSKYIQRQADAVFNYATTIGDKHNIEALAGFSYFDRETYSLSASGQGALTDIIPTLNAISTMTAMSSSKSRAVLLGYFGRVNYNYKQKYLVSANIRYDGASQLGASHKWGAFPGVSLGWNLHKEDFWQALAINDLVHLKLRGSYGLTGNISGLGDYQWQGAYSVGNKYMGNSAIQNTTIANPDLQWERSKTIDGGADISFFNERVKIIADIYRRTTDHLLANLTLPPSTGFSSIRTNYGSLENKGFEIELATQVFPAESKVQWDVTFNASVTKYKIKKLPDNGQVNNRVGGYYVWDPAIGDYNWLGGTQEGGRMGDMFAWKQTGIYATDEEAAQAPVDMMVPETQRKKYGGDVIYLDADGDNVIDTKDMVYVGNPYPKWTGGFSSSLRYKGFNLYARFDYMTGHTIYNYAKVYMIGTFGAFNLPGEVATKGWQGQGDTRATLSRVLYSTNYNYFRGSSYLYNTNSYFFEPGDFLCIRELTLSYDLPASLLQRIKLRSVKFNVTGNNLFYFTKYTGMSPEDGGNDIGRYPLPKNIIFGVKVSF
jgi:TonB-linked SusC/RagA family outer membrane protein